MYICIYNILFSFAENVAVFDAVVHCGNHCEHRHNPDAYCAQHFEHGSKFRMLKRFPRQNHNDSDILRNGFQLAPNVCGDDSAVRRGKLHWRFRQRKNRKILRL